MSTALLIAVATFYTFAVIMLIGGIAALVTHCLAPTHDCILCKYATPDWSSPLYCPEADRFWLLYDVYLSIATGLLALRKRLSRST